MTFKRYSRNSQTLRSAIAAACASVTRRNSTRSHRGHGAIGVRLGLLTLVLLEDQKTERRKPGGGMEAEVRKDHGEKRGRDLIRAGLEVFGISAKDRKTAAKSDWRKGILAEMVQRETTMTLNWISEKLAMGDRSSCSRIIRRTRAGMKGQKEWREWQRKIKKSINHA